MNSGSGRKSVEERRTRIQRNVYLCEEYAETVGNSTFPRIAALTTKLILEVFDSAYGYPPTQNLIAQLTDLVWEVYPASMEEASNVLIVKNIMLLAEVAFERLEDYEGPSVPSDNNGPPPLLLKASPVRPKREVDDSSIVLSDDDSVVVLKESVTMRLTGGEDDRREEEQMREDEDEGEESRQELIVKKEPLIEIVEKPARTEDKGKDARKSTQKLTVKKEPLIETAEKPGRKEKENRQELAMNNEAVGETSEKPARKGKNEKEKRQELTVKKEAVGKTVEKRARKERKGKDIMEECCQELCDKYAAVRENADKSARKEEKGKDARTSAQKSVEKPARKEVKESSGPAQESDVIEDGRKTKRFSEKTPEVSKRNQLGSSEDVNKKAAEKGDDMKPIAAKAESSYDWMFAAPDSPDIAPKATNHDRAPIRMVSSQEIQGPREMRERQASMSKVLSDEWRETNGKEEKKKNGDKVESSKESKCVPFLNCNQPNATSQKANYPREPIRFLSPQDIGPREHRKRRPTARILEMMADMEREWSDEDSIAGSMYLSAFAKNKRVKKERTRLLSEETVDSTIERKPTVKRALSPDLEEGETEDEVEAKRQKRVKRALTLNANMPTKFMEAFEWPNRRVQCPFCDEEIATSLLDAHRLRMHAHEALKLFGCDKCHQWYKSPLNAIKHSATMGCKPMRIRSMEEVMGAIGERVKRQATGHSSPGDEAVELNTWMEKNVFNDDAAQEASTSQNDPDME